MDSLNEIRKKLSQVVDREVWGGRRDLKDMLEAAVEPAIAEAYKRCAREARPITECYKEVAEAAGLSEILKRAWGKRA